MDANPASTSLFPCAKPGCGNLTTLAASDYVDGCGHVCPGCTSPLPDWAYDIDPPW